MYFFTSGKTLGITAEEYGPRLGFRIANLLPCGWLCEIPLSAEPWGAVEGAIEGAIGVSIQGGTPTVISWDIIPINYRYSLHKPKRYRTYKPT